MMGTKIAIPGIRLGLLFRQVVYTFRHILDKRYRLDGPAFDSRQGQESFLHRVQTGFEVHQAFYRM
jgi:hypothetical protein